MLKESNGGRKNEEDNVDNSGLEAATEEASEGKKKSKAKAK